MPNPSLTMGETLDRFLTMQYNTGVMLKKLTINWPKRPQKMVKINVFLKNTCFLKIKTFLGGQELDFVIAKNAKKTYKLS
jgi:hypothetical protein